MILVRRVLSSLTGSTTARPGLKAMREEEKNSADEWLTERNDKGLKWIHIYNKM